MHLIGYLVCKSPFFFTELIEPFQVGHFNFAEIGHVYFALTEVRAQLYIARDLDYISEDEFSQAFQLAERASRQLARFIAYLEAHPRSRRVRESQAEYNV